MSSEFNGQKISMRFSYDPESPHCMHRTKEIQEFPSTASTSIERSMEWVDWLLINFRFSCEICSGFALRWTQLKSENDRSEKLCKQNYFMFIFLSHIIMKIEFGQNWMSATHGQSSCGWTRQNDSLNFAGWSRSKLACWKWCLRWNLVHEKNCNIICSINLTVLKSSNWIHLFVGFHKLDLSRFRSRLSPYPWTTLNSYSKNFRAIDSSGKLIICIKLIAENSKIHLKIVDNIEPHNN